MHAGPPVGPPIAPLSYIDRRDTEARCTAPLRKSSGIESGGSRDFSGLTQRDLVPPQNLSYKMLSAEEQLD